MRENTEFDYPDDCMVSNILYLLFEHKSTTVTSLFQYRGNKPLVQLEKKSPTDEVIGTV